MPTNRLLHWGRDLASCLLLLALAALIVPVTRSETSTSAQAASLWATDATAAATINSPADGTYLYYLPMVPKTRLWRECSQGRFGTMLVYSKPGDRITPDSVLIRANNWFGVKGMAGAGAPSAQVRDQWFGKLPGWTRLFMRGKYADLEPIHETAKVFGMENMYECLGYGPERLHEAGQEALEPLTWVPRAEAVAEAAGKCLVYGPAIDDYEYMATPIGETKPRDDLMAGLIVQVAPYVDVWMIQLAKYQRWADGGHDDDGNPYSMDDFKSRVSWWVSWIKSGNAEAKVWTQLGIGQFDPIRQKCLPPQPPEYILQYRERLIEAGVDGVWVMPSLPCQISPDPQDHEYYLQTLTKFQDAIAQACGQ